MFSFSVRDYHLPHQIPLYLKNIAVFDVMEYRYLRGIRSLFDDKNDHQNGLKYAFSQVFELYADQISVFDQG
jgi:hypothetical protein